MKTKQDSSTTVDGTVKITHSATNIQHANDRCNEEAATAAAAAVNTKEQ